MRSIALPDGSRADFAEDCICTFGPTRIRRDEVFRYDLINGSAFLQHCLGAAGYFSPRGILARLGWRGHWLFLGMVAGFWLPIVAVLAFVAGVLWIVLRMNEIEMIFLRLVLLPGVCCAGFESTDGVAPRGQ